ncbi:MAG: transposase [Acidobacteriota bacterium]
MECQKKQLKNVIAGKMLVVWDGLTSHRSRLVKQYLASEPGRIEILHLPPYAPELNPVEYIWGYLKQHELPNICSKLLAETDYPARRCVHGRE